jgi:L-alanine-DL-glutamate epimerase-like enolase superfamily enzyme
VKLTARTATVQLAETFTISRGSEDEADVVQVEIEHQGVSGFGEAAPIERYAESTESAVDWLDRVDVGDDPFALDEIADRFPPGEHAARAAVDHALHDLQGKLTGQPVYKLLGLRRAGPPTSWTIWLGDPDDMARRTEKIAGRGFQRLKLKLGGRDGLDAERVKAVRSVTTVPLQCDVNEAWTLDEALEYLPQMELQYCEQPLPAGDPDGPELKQRAPLPIYVDEDCHTLADVAACAERAHGINIKLAKAGGIRESVRMVHAARALGLGVMLGCMVESGLGIAPGAHIASLMDHVDLDGNLLLARDPWPGVNFADGVQVPAERPGLGVSPA